jgi:hypothetical protein
MQLGSLCELGKSAPNPVLSTLRYFREEYEAHIDDQTCPAGICRELTAFEITRTATAATPAQGLPGGLPSPVRIKELHVINHDICISCGACSTSAPPIRSGPSPRRARSRRWCDADPHDQRTQGHRGRGRHHPRCLPARPVSTSRRCATSTASSPGAAAGCASSTCRSPGGTTTGSSWSPRATTRWRGDDGRHRLRAGGRHPGSGAGPAARALPRHAPDPEARGGPRTRPRPPTRRTRSPTTASCAVCAPGSAITSGISAISSVNRGWGREIAPPFNTRRRTASAVWPAPRSVPPTASSSPPTTVTRTIWGKDFEMLRDPKGGEAVITKARPSTSPSGAGCPMSYFETSDEAAPRRKRRDGRSRPSRSCRGWAKR